VTLPVEEAHRGGCGGAGQLVPREVGEMAARLDNAQHLLQPEDVVFKLEEKDAKGGDRGVKVAQQCWGTRGPDRP
jgi:hypothetical protein